MFVDPTTAEVRAATWHLDGRFIYRNKHGAVGYVHDWESNPGLLDLIEVRGKDAAAVAARLHVALQIAPAPDADVLQADLRDVLALAGLSDHARAASPHDVFREALAVLRERLTTHPAAQELAEICKVLGCITKPGVALQFVEKQERRISEALARNTVLLRSWDKANPTERQELDRLRRGWGPSSPTERMYRRENIASCLQALESAMGELTVSEEEADSVPSEAQIYLDAAHAGLGRHQQTILGMLQSIASDPLEWPDIKAAEERGAMQAQAARMPFRLQRGPLSNETTLFVGDGQLPIRADIAVVRRYLSALGLSETPLFRTGDCVIDKTSREPLTVAYADPDSGYLHWFGYPPGRAPSANYELTTAASDEWHRTALLQLKRSGGPVAEKALRLYGDPEASNG